MRASSPPWRMCWKPPGRSPGAARRRSSSRVPGRDLQAIDRRDARADPRQARPTGRHDYEYEREPRRQSLHDLRAAGGVAARRSDRPPRRSRLRESPQRLIRCALPAAEKIVSVQDNLSTHTPASLYAAFHAREARRLVERFEWHYTPKHGSWLDMAESELAVLIRQCLSRRIPGKQTLGERSRGLGAPPKQAPRQSRLAIHNQSCSRQTQKAVPSVRMTRAG